MFSESQPERVAAVQHLEIQQQVYNEQYGLYLRYFSGIRVGICATDGSILSNNQYAIC